MKIFRDISNYSKKRKLLLVEAIEKINWDTNYNPQEFLALLTGSQADKKWALTKMLAYMPYIRVRQLLTKEFLRESVTEEMIDTIYPPMRREEIFRVYRFCLGEDIIKRKIMEDNENNILINGELNGVAYISGGIVNQTINKKIINTNIEKIYNEGGTINAPYSEINLAPHTIPQILTQKTGLSKDIKFVGREEELQQIDELLNQNSILSINGVGGMGKSTLASYYLTKHKDKFDYYGLIQVDNNIKHNFANTFKSSLDLRQENIDDAFNETINKLQNLQGKKLLVIDDVKDISNQKEEIEKLINLSNSGFIILFTSRSNILEIESYPLDELSKKNARELFLQNYKTVETEKVDKILDGIGYHTYFIKMLSKTIDSEAYQLDFILQKIKNGELNKIESTEEDIILNQNLQELFSLQNLKEEDILLLKKISLLPSIEIEFSFLKDVIKNIRRGKINRLFKKGSWLTKQGDSYKLHQIIKEFIWANHQPTLEEMDSVILFFSKKMENIQDVELAVMLKKYLVYFESIDDILNRLGFYNGKVIDFWANLGVVYHKNGLYKKAEFLLIKVIKRIEKLKGTEHIDVAISCNELALLYKAMGKYEEAELFYLKTLKIWEKKKGKNHSTMAIFYNNLASLYIAMKKYDKAEELYLKALKKYIKVFGEEHSNTVICYDNLAGLYKDRKKYDKAKQIYIKVIDIFERTVGKEHFDTATSYNNLGLFYESIEEYEKVESLYLKSLKIFEKILGKEHPTTANSYNNLAVFYYYQEEFNKSYIFFKKAFEIRSKILLPNHPHLIDTKEGLENAETKVFTQYFLKKIQNGEKIDIENYEIFERVFEEFISKNQF